MWSRADFGCRSIAAVKTCVAGSNARSCSRLFPQSNRCSSVGVHVRGALVLLGRGHEIAATLLDVAEKVVELARVLQGQRAGRLLACRGQLACLEQDEGEVVAVGVLRRVDRLRPLKMRKRRVHLAVAQIKRCQSPMRLEAVRLLADGFEQAAFEVRRGRGLGRLLGGRRGLRDRYPRVRPTQRTPER